MQWHLDGAWSGSEKWLTFVHKLVRSNDGSLLTVWLNLEAVRFSLCRLSDRDAEETISVLLNALRPRNASVLAREVLPAMLSSEAPWAAILVRQMRAAMRTIGADAQRGRISSRQFTILETLLAPGCPTDMPARVIPGHLNRQDWTAGRRLTRLLPAIAASGESGASALLAQVAAESSRHSAETLAAVMAYPRLTDVEAHSSLPQLRTVQAHAVKIALDTGSYDRVLAAMVDKLDWTSEPLYGYRERVLKHARRAPSAANGSLLLFVLAVLRLNGTDSDYAQLRGIARRVPGPDQQIILGTINAIGDPRTAVLDYLARLIQVLPKERKAYRRTLRLVDPSISQRASEVLTNLLRSASANESPSSERPPHEWIGSRYHAQMLDYLSRAISIDPSRNVPIRRAHAYRLDPIAVNRLHTLLAYARPVDPDAWPKVRILGLYDYRESQVTAHRFGLTCHYLAELARTHPGLAVDHFVGYLDKVGDSDRFVAGDDVPPELRRMVELTCVHGDEPQLEALLRACVRLPESFVATVIRIVAELRYADLQRALPKALKMSPVSEFVMELSLDVERGRRTTAFTEILPNV